MANKSEKMIELEAQNERCTLIRLELNTRLNRLLQYKPDTPEGKAQQSKLEETLRTQLDKINNDLSAIKSDLEVATVEHLVSGVYSDEEPASSN